nr:hypothetical protein [Tanacetum cinerariifolium]
MGELTFFLGLQVKQKKDEIFISQDKYVAEILRKFSLTNGKSASTPIDTEKPLLKDPDVKRIFRYLKGKPHLGLWYPKDSPFNLVAYSDSDYAGASLDRKSTTRGYASEGFNQIINLLNASSIKYALTVNPNIYVSVIKQFWTSVVVKKVNDVTRLQALVDKKKVIISEATIRDALRLDDAKGIECLPNEEIFTKLARMGYEKPSTKLTFYKAFFSSQWKFLIHNILQCMSVKRTSWNECSSSMASTVIYLSTGRNFNFSKYIFDSLVRNVDIPTKFYMYPRFLQLMIRTQVGDLSSHTTTYSSPALTQKVFANMRRVGKGCFGVETPRFERMIVAQQVGEGTTEVNIKDVSTACVYAKGAASAADDKVPAAVDEPSIPSPPPATQPPPSSQDIPFTSQVGTTQRIETSDDPVMDEVSKQGRIIANMDADKDLTLKDVAIVAKDIDLEHADNVLSMKDVDIEPAELQEVVEVVTTAKLITEVVTAGSVTITVAAPQLTTTAAPNPLPSPKASNFPQKVTAAKATMDVTLKDVVAVAKDVQDADIEESLDVVDIEPVELQEVVEVVTTSKLITEVVTAASATITAVIDHVQRKEKKDNAVKRYQALKRKPQTKAQARKNMMIYLRNVARFKIDYFKGMTYDDICLIFEKKFNSNVAFLQKKKDQMEKEDSRALKRLSECQEDKAAKKKKLDEEVEELRKHLQIVPNDDDDDVYTEATPLALKVPVVDYEIYTENNKPYYKIKRADGSHQLYLSFLSMLRNCDKEDLEVL